MWPFRRKTVKVQMTMEFALTGDKRSLANYSECAECHHLVNNHFTKVVELHSETSYPPDTKTRYCLGCAPEWDLIVLRWSGGLPLYYKRVPAVPETFEEVNLPDTQLRPMSGVSASEFHEAIEAEKAAQKAETKAKREVAAEKEKIAKGLEDLAAKMAAPRRKPAPKKLRTRAKKPTK